LLIIHTSLLHATTFIGKCNPLCQAHFKGTKTLSRGAYV
jgi:hypothetical protein